ncbi:hypothetical protein TNCV_4306831 [Trichonephila clavipes]|nr:hypothetical protein TNCV_4306831 [Trichonephila clavipes]
MDIHVATSISKLTGVSSIMALKNPCSDAPEKTFDDSVEASLDITPQTTEQQKFTCLWLLARSRTAPPTACLPGFPHVSMAPQDVLYFPSTFVHGIRRQPVDVVGNRIKLLEFRIKFVEGLLHKYDVFGQKNHSQPPTASNPVSLTERHFITHISPTFAKLEYKEE